MPREIGRVIHPSVGGDVPDAPSYTNKSFSMSNSLCLCGAPLTSPPTDGRVTHRIL